MVRKSSMDVPATAAGGSLSGKLEMSMANQGRPESRPRKNKRCPSDINGPASSCLEIAPPAPSRQITGCWWRRTIRKAAFGCARYSAMARLSPVPPLCGQGPADIGDGRDDLIFKASGKGRLDFR